MPVPTKPAVDEVNAGESETSEQSSRSVDVDPVYEGSSSLPHLISQTEMNDLVRDLGLSKTKSELLVSRLKGWNLLQAETNITEYRNRDKEFVQYFKQDNDLSYCDDVEGLMTVLGHEYNSVDWRLFIDSSSQGLAPGKVEEKNVLHKNLVDPTKIYLPPLHIKLGLMKNLVKALDRDGPGFQYLKSKFPRISEAKIIERI